ncbi:MAG: lysophospholipase [Oligoflexia bacterium]|nr:lysophospholipase [Oligoflexia bacterium]
MPNPMALGIVQPAGFPPLPAGWSTEFTTYPSHDGELKLFSATHTRPDLKKVTSRPLRALVIAHGIGEHGGRYLHFPHYLADTVDLLFCPDHRGHGRSEGLRGHVDRFTDYSEDLRVGIERLGSQYEIHVLGHSMGSLILMNLLMDHPELPLYSAILSSPLLAVSVEVPLIKKAAAGALSNLWGNLQIRTGLNASMLSHDAAVVEAYRKDRLVHDFCTPRLYTEMSASMKKISHHAEAFAERVRLPLLMQVPTGDKIVNSEAAIGFFHAVKSAKKDDTLKLKTYPGFFHEAYNETGKQQTFEDLKEWLSSETSSSS